MSPRVCEKVVSALLCTAVYLRGFQCIAVQSTFTAFPVVIAVKSTFTAFSVLQCSALCFASILTALFHL